jgi:hypothetical protein
MITYWEFKVLSGISKATLEFDDFSKMKEFSANLSAMYPKVVSTYKYKTRESEEDKGNQAVKVELPCSQERVSLALAHLNPFARRCLERSIKNDRTEDILMWVQSYESRDCTRVK